MKLQSQAVLHGIKSSKGEIEGRGYDSTTFHISVDLGSASNGESIGVVTRPLSAAPPKNSRSGRTSKTTGPPPASRCCVNSTWWPVRIKPPS